MMKTLKIRREEKIDGLKANMNPESLGRLR